MKTRHLLLIFAAVVCIPGDLVAQQYGRSAPTDEGHWMILYEVDGEFITYAVILGPSDGEIKGRLSSTETLSGTLRKRSVIFHHPNGEDVEILGTRRVIHAEGGIISELTTPMDADTFVAFMNSRPKDYRLKTLLAFAEARTKGSAEAEKGGADRSATAPDSKPEGNENPEPESEERPH